MPKDVKLLLEHPSKLSDCFWDLLFWLFSSSNKPSDVRESVLPKPSKLRRPLLRGLLALCEYDCVEALSSPETVDAAVAPASSSLLLLLRFKSSERDNLAMDKVSTTEKEARRDCFGLAVGMMMIDR